MIRAVMFDFGGVLVRASDPVRRRAWETRLGLPENALARTLFESEVAERAMIGRATDADAWRHLAATYGLSEAQLRDLQREFWLDDQLDAGLADFLRDLRPRYKTAILSNAWPGARESFMSDFGLHRVVDAMIISAEEGVAKPDARIYRVALDRLGVQPEEAVFVDDLAVNVEGARALGMQAIRFQDRHQVLAELQHVLDGATGV